MTQYRVEVKTGNKNYAGTDADVYIQLIGAIGTSPPKKIDNAQDNFEKNKLDTFVIDLESVGWIDEIRIYHDNSGSCSGWFLDYVKVTDLSVGLTFRADFYRWLATDEDDHRIDVTRPVPIGPVELVNGSIASTFMGYVPRRRQTQSTPLNEKEVFRYTFKEGVSLRKEKSESIAAGVSIGGSFFGFGCSFTTSLTSTISQELNSYEEQTSESATEVQIALEPYKSITCVTLYYQDIVSGEARANGASMGFEQRFLMHADHSIHDGWLSNNEVEAVVRELLCRQIAEGGGGSQLPPAIPSVEAKIRIAERPIYGPINWQSVAEAQQGLTMVVHP